MAFYGTALIICEHLHSVARGLALALVHWIMNDWDTKGEFGNEVHGDTIDRDVGES
jgi:hypothetical protein